jgi:hypothetical protein
MKIQVMNDRKIPMNLRVRGQSDEPWSGSYFLIEPASLKEVELEMPEGAVPFLKIWENNTAFLTYSPRQE